MPVETLKRSTPVERGARKAHSSGPPPIGIGDFDPGDDGSDRQPARTADNAFLAMLLFIGADIMFFAGLVGAFVVFRFGAEAWPPPGQPRLPIGVTTFNTVILLLSGVTMVLTWRLLKSGSKDKIKRGLWITAALGVFFLLVQGYEWVRLLHFGLTLSQGVFGATFYTMIGCHALHVAGAVVWLLTLLLTFNGRASRHLRTGFLSVKLSGMYWFLVVALWPVLFGLVYLS